MLPGPQPGKLPVVTFTVACLSLERAEVLLGLGGLDIFRLFSAAETIIQCQAIRQIQLLISQQEGPGFYLGFLHMLQFPSTVQRHTG